MSKGRKSETRVAYKKKNVEIFSRYDMPECVMLINSV